MQLTSDLKKKRQFFRGWLDGVNNRPMSWPDDTPFDEIKAYRHGHDVGYYRRMQAEEEATKHYGE